MFPLCVAHCGIRRRVAVDYNDTHDRLLRSHAGRPPSFLSLVGQTRLIDEVLKEI